MVDVALFPIPNAVSFPGVPKPLHVFEPRYRQMVKFCMENQSLVGVCHTERILHTNAREQTWEEMLNSNQSTYKPCKIFSAGPVELLAELDDGRMMITLDTNIRLRLREEKQTLPFSVWACEELPDEPVDASAAVAMEQTREKILKRLLAVTHGTPVLQEQIESDFWQTMPAQPFSFAIAGILGLPPDVAQRLLEMTNAQERLDTVLTLLNNAFPGR
jgi:Lon protease-like protein